MIIFCNSSPFGELHRLLLSADMYVRKGLVIPGNGVIEILDVKVDLKAGFVISLKHHGGFGDRHEQVRA